jgi:hypothetical protein
MSSRPAGASPRRWFGLNLIGDGSAGQRFSGLISTIAGASPSSGCPETWLTGSFGRIV